MPKFFSRRGRRAAAAAAAAAMNLAFLLADDHAVTAVGAYGRRLSRFAQTKHIDALAARGATFENACTTSLCAPSRASFITGRYAHRHGVIDLARHGTLNQSNNLSLPNSPPARLPHQPLRQW